MPVDGKVPSLLSLRENGALSDHPCVRDSDGKLKGSSPHTNAVLLRGVVPDVLDGGIVYLKSVPGSLDFPKKVGHPSDGEHSKCSEPEVTTGCRRSTRPEVMPVLRDDECHLSFALRESLVPPVQLPTSHITGGSDGIGGLEAVSLLETLSSRIFLFGSLILHEIFLELINYKLDYKKLPKRVTLGNFLSFMKSYPKG